MKAGATPGMRRASTWQAWKRENPQTAGTELRPNALEAAALSFTVTNRFNALAKARHGSLESYRRDGRAVRTPIWIVAEGEKLYCWTISDTGKVKRISGNPRVRLAKCSARGHVRGGWVDAEANVLASPGELPKQMRRMRTKYGLLFLPFAWWPRLTRTATTVIEFSEAGETT